MIKKVGSKYILYSKTKKKGHRRRLGTFSSREQAMKREKQIQYFKHLNEENGPNVSGGGDLAGFSTAIGSKALVFPKDNKRKPMIQKTSTGKKFKRYHSKKDAKPKMATLPESEQKLRESLRKIIFLNKVKFYEEKGKQYLQEQKLRRVIQYLIKEEEEDPALANLDTTGEIKAYKAFKKTLTGIKNSYKDLISSFQQRESFKDIFYDGVKEYFRKLQQMGTDIKPVEKPEEKNINEPVLPSPEASMTTEPASDLAKTSNIEGEETPLAEQEGEVPDVSSETEATPEDIKAKEAEAEKFRKQLAAQTVAQVQQSRNDVNVTGAKEAYDSLKTALPQLGAEFAKLSDPQDKQAFIDLLLGADEDETRSTIISTMNAFETELNNTNPNTRQG